MNPHNAPCSPEQIAAIAHQAQARVNYLKWLAKEQMKPNCDELIRRQVAEVLAQLTEGTS